jgi:hypothetical protein
MQSVIRAVASNPAMIAGCHPTISVFDELHAAPSGPSGRAMWDALIPVPSRKVSCRLAISHAGPALDDHLLYVLYKRGMELPELGEDLRGGAGMLCFWTHKPQHHWQDGKWLQQMRRELLPAQYTYMIENHFISSEASYITPEMFDRNVRESAPRPSDQKLPLFVGVDAAPKRDNTALFGVTLEGNDGVRLVCHKVFVPSHDDPLDFESTVERTLLDWQQRYAIRLVLVDPSWMIATNQRLQRAGLKVEELKQNPENLRAMAQVLFDLFRSERIHLYTDAKLRDTVTRTVFEESTAGLRFARQQSVKIDASVALSMACLAALRTAGKPRYRLDVFSPNFVDDDAPPQPISQPEPVRANADWWRSMPRSQPTSSADERLRAFYQSLRFRF